MKNVNVKYFERFFKDEYNEFVEQLHELVFDVQCEQKNIEPVLSFCKKELSMLEYLANKYKQIRLDELNNDIEQAESQDQKEIFERFRYGKIRDSNISKNWLIAYGKELDKAMIDLNQLLDVKKNESTAPKGEQAEIDEHIKILKEKSYIDENCKLLEGEQLVIELILKLKNNIPLTDSYNEAKSKIRDLGLNKRLRKIENKNLAKYKLINKQNNVIKRFRLIPDVKTLYGIT